MTATKTRSHTGNLRGMKKPWEFDIPLDHEGMTVRRTPNNATATRKSRPVGHVSSQKKRYSPKHLRMHRIAVRPSILLLVLLAAFLLGVTIGLVTRPTTTALAASDDVSRVETVQQTSATPDEIPAQEAAPIAADSAPEPIRHRNDIMSEGRLLSFDLQEVMQDCCEKYNVPYALALAIAEVESHFNPDAKSSTNDFGLMQINAINLDWLRDMGMDPLTPAGNIESGVYIIAQHLQAYGDPELALMAYNNGPTGAKKLWNKGIFQTGYSQKVMAAFVKWTSILGA